MPAVWVAVLTLAIATRVMPVTLELEAVVVLADSIVLTHKVTEAVVVAEVEVTPQIPEARVTPVAQPTLPLTAACLYQQLLVTLLA